MLSTAGRVSHNHRMALSQVAPGLRSRRVAVLEWVCLAESKVRTLIFVVVAIKSSGFDTVWPSVHASAGPDPLYSSVAGIKTSI